MARRKRTYSDDFKRQIVNLIKSGKPRSEIQKEYDLSSSTLSEWMKQDSYSGSFKAKDNKTPEQKELEQLRKDNKQLKMENDILKQAALIMGRK